MPVGSEPSSGTGAVALPHTWRPLGVRLAAGLVGGVLLVVCVFAWLAFGAETRARFTAFQVGTLVSLGILVAGIGYALARSRVVAEPGRLVVVNGYRRREFTYAQVLAAHLPPGAPWVTLDLADGTTVSAMGIQGSDGDRARRAVRELRTVISEQTG